MTTTKMSKDSSLRRIAYHFMPFILFISILTMRGFTILPKKKNKKKENRRKGKLNRYESSNWSLPVATRHPLTATIERKTIGLHKFWHVWNRSNSECDIFVSSLLISQREPCDWTDALRSKIYSFEKIFFFIWFSFDSCAIKMLFT